MTENTMKLLVAAIIDRAIKDWKKADTQLSENPAYRPALRTKREINEFFQGDWFEFLCDINPDYENLKLQEMCV